MSYISKENTGKVTYGVNLEEVGFMHKGDEQWVFGVEVGQAGRLAQRYNSVWNILKAGIMCD